MLFIDKNSNVDKEALRLYVLCKLQELRNEFGRLLKSGEHRPFWESLHNTILSETDKKSKEELLRVESQLTRLIDYVDTWVMTAVDSPERMEFFVQTKALEIRSGNSQGDYFWALQIRHDQLVAVVKMLELLASHISEWVEMNPGTVINTGVFLGMVKYTVEDQIYLEAEKIQRERQRLMTRISS
jgi:hypothetical protein